MRHIICLLLENEPGALSRVAGLFSARGYNIESLSVAPTEDSSVSRMTITTSGSEAVLEQITKQLNKLVDVVKLLELTEGAHVERAMMLAKVRATGPGREEIKRLSDIFRGRILDVTNSTYIIDCGQWWRTNSRSGGHRNRWPVGYDAHTLITRRCG